MDILLAPLLLRFVLVVLAPAAGGPPAPDAPPPAALEGGLPGSRSLVIALHGGSFRGRPPPELAQRLLMDLSAEARATGLRLLVPVAPELPDTDRYLVPWLQPQGEALVLSLVQRETAAHRADGGRITLAGHGAGATGALTLAARHPDIVAAVAAWSGTPEPLWDDQHRVIGLAEPVIPGLRDTPVFLFSARDDPVIDRACLQLFVDGLQLEKQSHPSAPLTWIESEGGHGFGAAGPARGLRFLRNHSKSHSRQTRR